MDEELQVEPQGSRADIRAVGAATTTRRYFVVASFKTAILSAFTS